MYLQGVDDIYDLAAAPIPDGRLTTATSSGRTSGSRANTASTPADPDRLFRLFEEYEKECRALIEKKLPLPPYDYCLKCSHVLQPARCARAISVTERQGYILSRAQVAQDCARSISPRGRA